MPLTWASRRVRGRGAWFRVGSLSHIAPIRISEIERLGSGTDEACMEKVSGTSCFLRRVLGRGGYLESGNWWSTFSLRLPVCRAEFEAERLWDMSSDAWQVGANPGHA